MDYGKLAYSKIEDLQARLDLSAKKPEMKSVKLKSLPNINLKIGEYKMAEFYGSGIATILAKILIAFDGVTEGAISVAVDGKYLESCFINGADGEKEYFIMAAAEIDGGKHTISVYPSGKADCRIKYIESIILGNEVKSIRSLSDFSLDKNDSKFLLLRSVDESAECALSDKSKIAFQSAENIYLGYGHRYDVVGAGEFFYIAMCDNFDNLWFFKLDGNLNIVNIRGDYKRCERVTIAKMKNHLAVAALISGKAYQMQLSEDLQYCSNLIPIDLSGKVDDVKFAKGTLLPVLIAEIGGKCFAKLSIEEYESRENLSYNMNAKLEF